MIYTFTVNVMIITLYKEDILLGTSFIEIYEANNFC